ncbi:MAG: carbohydrate ABC transporter permease [Roseiflexaceae bacterium]|jgi:multiple sugar transport system permease protein|nr:sugar ABC transporter permease [Chloroflexaceae bacterium]
MASLRVASASAKRNWRQRRETIDAYVFMSPVIIGLLVFTIGPIIVSLFLSFTKYNLLSDPKWVGIDNYTKMYGEDLFWKSLSVSAIYSVVSVPVGLVVALFLAMLLNRKMRGVYFFRSIYYLPTVISGVGVAMLWRWIFNGQYGVLNTLLRTVGIKGPNWLLDENYALAALIITSIWGVGGTMLIFLAGLQGIPSELLEAAEIDGAGRWAQFRYITLPMISHVTFFNLVLGIIGALQVFTDAFVITNGGPNNATLFIAVYLYRHAFMYLNFGYAAALAWVLFLIVMMLTLMVFRSSPLWVFYERDRQGRP